MKNLLKLLLITGLTCHVTFAQMPTNNNFSGCMFSQSIQPVNCSPRVKGLPPLSTFLGNAKFSSREEAEQRMDQLFKKLYSLDQKINKQINQSGVYPRGGSYMGTMLNFNGKEIQIAADWNTSYHTIRMNHNFTEFDGQVDCTRILNASFLKPNANDIYDERSYKNEFNYKQTFKELRDNYNKFIPSWNVNVGERRRGDSNYDRWFSKNTNPFIDSSNFISVYSNEFQRGKSNLYSENPNVDPTWRYIILELEKHGIQNESDLFRFQMGLVESCQHYELKGIQEFYAESIKRVRVIKKEQAKRDAKCDPLMEYAQSNLTLPTDLIDDKKVKAEISSKRNNIVKNLVVNDLIKYITYTIQGANERFSTGKLTSKNKRALLDARIASDVLYCAFRFQSDETMITKLDQFIYSLTHSTVTSDISPNSCDCTESTYSKCRDFSTYTTALSENVKSTDAVYKKLITPAKMPSNYVQNLEKRRDIPFRSMFTKIGDEFLNHATMTYLTMLYTYDIVDFKPLVESQSNGTNVNLQKDMVVQYGSYGGGAMGGGGVQRINYGKKVRGLSEESFKELVRPLGTCGKISDTSDMCQKFLEISQKYMIKGLVEVDHFIKSGKKKPVKNCGMGANGKNTENWEKLIFSHFSPTNLKNRIEKMGRGLSEPVSACDGKSKSKIKSSLTEALALAINDIIQNDILTQDFKGDKELFKKYVSFLPFLYTETFLSNFQIEPAQPVPFSKECYPQHFSPGYGGGYSSIPTARYQSFTVTPVQIPSCRELKSDLKKIIVNIPMGIINPRKYFLSVDWSRFFTKVDYTFSNFFKNLKEVYITGEQRHLASMPPSMVAGMSLDRAMKTSSETIDGSGMGFAKILNAEEKDHVTHLKLLLDSITKNPSGKPYQSYFLEKFPQKSPQICALYEKIEYDTATKVLIEKSMKKWYSFWKWASIIVTAIAVIIVPFGGAALAGVAFTKFLIGATIATYLGSTVMALWKGDFTAEKMFQKELKASSYMTVCMEQMSKMEKELSTDNPSGGNTQAKMNAACGESFKNLKLAKSYNDKLNGIIKDWAIETAMYAFYIAGSVHHLKHLSHHIHEAQHALKAAKSTGIASDIAKAEKALQHSKSMYGSSFEGIGEAFAKTLNGPAKVLEQGASAAGKLSKAKKLGRFVKAVYKASQQAGKNYLKNLSKANLGIKGNTKSTLKNLKGDYSYLGSKGFKGYYYSAAWMGGKTKYAKYFFMSAPSGLLAHLIFDELATDYISNKITNGSAKLDNIESIDLPDTEVESWYDQSVKTVEDIEAVEGTPGVVLALGRKMKEYEYNLDIFSDSEAYQVGNVIKREESEMHSRGSGDH